MTEVVAKELLGTRPGWNGGVKAQLRWWGLRLSQNPG